MLDLVGNPKAGCVMTGLSCPMLFQSLYNFLLDPTGDIPWDEEPDAGDVVHIANEQVHIDRSNIIFQSLTSP